jgi:hypothetical protein
VAPEGVTLVGVAFIDVVLMGVALVNVLVVDMSLKGVALISGALVDVALAGVVQARGSHGRSSRECASCGRASQKRGFL